MTRKLPPEPGPNKRPKRKAHPISKSELALRARRARSSITEACKKTLADAVMPDGRVDVRHPVVVAWANDRGVSAAELLDPSPIRGVEMSENPDHLGGPSDIGDLMDMRVGDVFASFGTGEGVGALQDWLTARKTIADTRRIELAVLERQRTLISRELVSTHLIGALETFSMQVLRDGSTKIASTLRKAIANDTTPEEQLLLVRDVIGSHLKAAKAEVTKKLDDLSADSGGDEMAEKPASKPKRRASNAKRKRLG